MENFMPDLDKLKKAILKPKNVQLFEIYNEDELTDKFEEILIFTPENFGIDEELIDVLLGEYLDVNPEDTTFTDTQKIEYGLSMFADVSRLYQSIETYVETVFYKFELIDAQEYYIAYHAIVENPGMGAEIEISKNGLIGIFTSVKELEEKLDSDGYSGFFTNPKKLEQDQSKYILENWEK